MGERHFEFFVFGNFPAETKFRWKEPIPAEYKVNRTGSKHLKCYENNTFRVEPFHFGVFFFYEENLITVQYEFESCRGRRCFSKLHVQ